MPIVKSEDAEIYYEVHGEGPPVVFAHGAGGNTLIWWQQIPFFAHNHKVIVFDHRGFGRSRSDTTENLASHFPDDLKAILDTVGVDRASLVCQSMGGWSGMPFTLQNPDRVSCLILSGTPGGIQTPKLRAEREKRQKQRTANASPVGQWNASHWALASDAFDRNPNLSFLYSQISALNPPRGDTGLNTVAINPEQLHNYTTPTCMIIGEHDRIFPLEAMREISTLIPGAEFHEISNVGHSPYFESADTFNKIAGAFIAKHAS